MADVSAKGYEAPSGLLETMLSHLGDFAYVFDLEGRFIYANRPLLDLLGIGLADIVGRNFHDLQYPPELAARLQTQIAEVISTGKPMRDETPFAGVSGETEFYEYLFTPVFGEGGAVKMVAGSTRNITSRVQAERRLDAALIAGEIGTWIFEVGTNRVFADRNLAALFGVTEAEAYGGPIEAYLRAIHPEDLDRVRASIESALQDGREFEAQYRLVTSRGERTVLARGHVERDPEGRPIRLPGVVLDLTDQRRAEAELSNAEARLGIAIEAAQLGTFYCPMPLAEIVWNDRCKEHFWLPPDAVVTIDRFFDILHPDDREPTRQAIERALSERMLYDVEYRTVSPEGRIRWVRALGRGFYNPVGEPTSFDGITIDISDKKLIEEVREEALAAERAARAESERSSQLKDDFLATLSHELRTPLNAILGWAQVLRTSAKSPEDVEQGLATIERNARAQTQIIEDLLEMSRIISGKIRLDVQTVNLASVVEAAVETVRPSAVSKGIELQMLIDPSAKSMSGDPNRLQQVFWNLLSNAIKFTSRTGKVRVVLRRVDSHVEVSVSDTGQGMDPAFLPHVFDRFRQADGSSTRSHGGLGLGLAIVKQLVELHGGTVRAESAGIDLGSTFTVSLPWTAVTPAEPTSEAPRHPVSTFAAQGGLPLSLRVDGVRVVVLDDQPEARALVARVLQDNGATVWVAETANEALALVESKRPDALVSDIGMPGEDGYSLIKRVRALPHDRGGNTPAIALTAYARAEDRMKAVLAGFQMHVSKPVEGAELLAMVASIARKTG